MSLTQEQFVQKYYDLFAGRPDVYAFRITWTEETVDGQKIEKSGYINTNYNGEKESTKERVRRVGDVVGTLEYDLNAVKAHLFGKQFLGIYPLFKDSTVRFAALDFDGDTPEDAYNEAIRHYNQFRDEAGLPCYLEISQSGNGYHLWFFFEDSIDAAVVRKALKPYINKSDYFDRMFPNQSRVSEHKPFGNLIALPLFSPKVKEGKNTFISEGIPVKGLRDFIENIERIPTQKIEDLAASAPEIADDVETRIREGSADEGIVGVTKLLDSRFGCNWIRWMMENPEEVDEPNWYALACNLAQLRGGRDVFHEISSLDSRYSIKATDAKFNQAIEKNAPHSCEYIRDNLSGPGCNCDKRYPGKVFHPYGLATIPVYDLMQDVKGDDVIEHINEGLEDVFAWAQEIQKNPLLGTGYPYGITSIDEFTGLRNSTLNVWAARPSIGKTAIALDVAYRSADSGVPVYIFSLEMSREQLWRRIMGRAAGVSLTKMVKGELSEYEWELMKNKTQEIKDRGVFPIYVDDTTRDIRKIMDIAWNLKEQYGHGIVMIDYLGLLDWYKGENEYSGITRNSKESKLMAKALNMPVVMLHQFNRQGDDMDVGAEVHDSWLRSSGQIEQDSDSIIYMLGQRGVGVKEREIVIVKERDREAGHRILLEFDAAKMIFGPAGSFLSLNNTHTPANVGVRKDGNDDILSWEIPATPEIPHRNVPAGPVNRVVREGEQPMKGLSILPVNPPKPTLPPLKDLVEGQVQTLKDLF